MFNVEANTCPGGKHVQREADDHQRGDRSLRVCQQPDFQEGIPKALWDVALRLSEDRALQAGCVADPFGHLRFCNDGYRLADRHVSEPDQGQCGQGEKLRRIGIPFYAVCMWLSVRPS